MSVLKKVQIEAKTPEEAIKLIESVGGKYLPTYAPEDMRHGTWLITIDPDYNLSDIKNLEQYYGIFYESTPAEEPCDKE